MTLISLIDILEAMSEPVQYHCDYCRRDLSNTVRVRCAECAEFDLCVACFSQGVELRSHKNSHDYRVIDNMFDFILFHFIFISFRFASLSVRLLWRTEICWSDDAFASTKPQPGSDFIVFCS